MQGWRAHEPRVDKPIQGISVESTNRKTDYTYCLALSALVLGSRVVILSRPGYALRWRVVYDSPKVRRGKEVGTVQIMAKFEAGPTYAKQTGMA